VRYSLQFAAPLDVSRERCDRVPPMQASNRSSLAARSVVACIQGYGDARLQGCATDGRPFLFYLWYLVHISFMLIFLVFSLHEEIYFELLHLQALAWV
jgi:hypothetical protein